MKTLFSFLLLALSIILVGCGQYTQPIECNIEGQKITFKQEDIKKFKGKVALIIADNFNEGTSTVLYYLTTTEGKTYQLKPCNDKVPLHRLQPNQTVEVEGVLYKNILYVIRFK